MTAFFFPGKVHLEGNKTAVSGQPATLSCWYGLPERVHQVLWRQTAEQGDTTTVASYARRGHQSIAEQFKGRVSLSRSLGDTQLTIKSVRMEDEACYTCEFHTYPDGTKSATACLSVYGEHLTVSLILQDKKRQRKKQKRIFLLADKVSFLCYRA